MLLVPGDPLNPRRDDPHFAAQAAAARAAGVPVNRVDHDALVRATQDNGEAAAAVAGVPASEDAVYRGWMLSSAQYAALAEALEARGVHLRTSAEEYRTAHELPGWYDALRSVTPESVWTEGSDLVDLVKAARGLGAGAGVLRDHVKSMKHHWSEACYLPDVLDDAAVERIGARFLELRDDAFTGGFVVRRFEEFTGAEARTWWIGGRCVLTTPHPDTPDELPTGLDLIEIEPLVAELALPFVTVDVIRRTDGAWRVVELGDGQVSDWPATADPAELVSALFQPGR
ncbi:ATP-grasp domain-containing protein [Kribbella sp. CA-253562]|uniref:ATP-grasp domain-containing protein n=1 Tax=Kribbella sp. CA-253562 TaxID=3239942 RepID=UPI003D93348D